MEQVNPVVSIIVPNYNHEKFLKQRLESIFNQTYINFEVILLDDCSTDKSQEILLEYAENPKVSHCVFNETNSGNTFVQWNKGISLAKGDYIWIAESDDFCDCQFLEIVSKPLIENTKIALSYCQSNRVDEFGVCTGNWLNHTDNLDSTMFLTNFVMGGNEFVGKFLIEKNVIPNASAVLFKRAIAVELDIDPVLKTCGDWLFYLKLIANNEIAYVHESLNYFRYHSKSVIAGTLKTESIFSIIDIELKMRKKMIAFLLIKKPYNLTAIIKKDAQIRKIFKYNKALFFLRNDKKIRGLLVGLTIPVFFLKKYKFNMKAKMKMDKFFKSIYKK